MSSFDVGFRGAPGVLAEIAGAGFKYVSSRLWGPHTTVPSPLEQAHNYAEDGFPQLWPPIYPEMQLHGYVKTPAEEFNVHRFFVDRALADGLEYATLIWHPWSLNRFDPEMRMLELMFDYVARQGIGFARFEDLWRARG